MTDIVERLRAEATDNRRYEVNGTLAVEAADTITALRAENERLRAALRESADELDAYYRAEYPGDHPYSKRKLAEAMASNPARAALGGKDE